MDQSEKVCQTYAQNVNGDTVSLFRNDGDGAFVVWHYTDQSPQLVWYAQSADAATAFIRTRERWNINGELQGI